MRLEQMTVHLRSRSSWEAMELGFALVRREASVIWKAWLLVTLPLFLLLNFAAWSADMLWSAWLLMLWLKPVFDRIPLFVISRSVFGATPGIGETLRAQLDWGWRPMLAYLTWRRFSPARSLLMPIELLEGGKGFRLRERRRVLGGAVYGNAALLTFVCLLFETALIGGCIFTIALYVRPELLPETLRTAWSMIGHERPWWVTFAGNAFAWLAVSVIEPFFVGAGFGLYLNRRTQIEAWDVEIAFRKLRARLAAAATPLALVLVLGLALLGTGLLPAHAQQAGGSAAAADAKPDTAPTLPAVFGDSRVDESRFSKAVDKAYRDPLLNAKRKQVTWEKRDKTKPRPQQQSDLSWLAGFGKAFAFIAEWGLWFVVVILVVLLLVSMRYWLPWMRGLPGRHKRLPVEVETEALQIPDTLPDNVPAEARRLWTQGRPRNALALLYRASVESMATRAEVALPPGATESECLRASRRMPDGEDRSLFARMVKVWQYAAYARQLPTPEDFDVLLSSLQQRFRWTA